MNTAVLHQKHRDGTVIIVGSAPSLRDVDMDAVSKLPTIGCNRILQHEKFKPTYLMVADRRPYMEEVGNHNYGRNAKDIKILLSTTIFDKKISCHGTNAQPLPGFTWYPWRVGVSSTPFNGTSFAIPLCSFASISGPMLQAACIMGAKRIGVVGVDMERPKKGPMHFYQEADWEGANSGAYKPGQQILPDKQLSQYRNAFEWLKGHGIEVVNLSPWKDTVFSKAFGTSDLHEFVSQSI